MLSSALVLPNYVEPYVCKISSIVAGVHVGPHPVVTTQLIWSPAQNSTLIRVSVAADSLVMPKSFLIKPKVSSKAENEGASHREYKDGRELSPGNFSQGALLV